MQIDEKKFNELKDMRWVKGLGSRVLGKERLDDKEIEYFYKWQEELKQPRELVAFAIKYCVYVQKVKTFAYFDKVITDWKQNSVVTEEEAMQFVYNGSSAQGRQKSSPAPSPVVIGSRPEPVEIFGLRVMDKKQILAVKPDGMSTTVYVQNVPFTFEEPIDSVMKAINGNTNTKTNTVSSQSAQDYSAYDDDDEDEVSNYEKARRAYDMLCKSTWHETEIEGGTDKQKSFANSIREKARTSAMSLCHTVMDLGPNANGPVESTGLTADAVAAVAEFVNGFFSTTNDFQSIIDKSKEMQIPGLIAKGKEWMQTGQIS